MEAVFIILTGILLGMLLPAPRPWGGTADLLAEILRRVLRRL